MMKKLLFNILPAHLNKFIGNCIFLRMNFIIFIKHERTENIENRISFSSSKNTCTHIFFRIPTLNMTHTYKVTKSHTNILTLTHQHKHKYTHTHTHTHTQTQTPTPTHKHTPIHKQTHTHVYTRSHSHTNTITHKYTHTNKLARTQI